MDAAGLFDFYLSQLSLMLLLYTAGGALPILVASCCSTSSGSLPQSSLLVSSSSSPFLPGFDLPCSRSQLEFCWGEEKHGDWSTCLRYQRPSLRVSPPPDRGHRLMLRFKRARRSRRRVTAEQEEQREASCCLPLPSSSRVSCASLSLSSLLLLVYPQSNCEPPTLSIIRYIYLRVLSSISCLLLLTRSRSRNYPLGTSACCSSSCSHSSSCSSRDRSSSSLSSSSSQLSPSYCNGGEVR